MTFPAKNTYSDELYDAIYRESNFSLLAFGFLWPLRFPLCVVFVRHALISLTLLRDALRSPRPPSRIDAPPTRTAI